MAQVKIFKTIESEVADLEKEVNAWLSEHNVTVINVFGNIAPQTIVHQTTGASGRIFSPSDIMLVVLYE